MVKEYRQKKVRKIMKTTLLIMAAGIGSRFGTGIKQLEPVDDATIIASFGNIPAIRYLL